MKIIKNWWEERKEKKKEERKEKRESFLKNFNRVQKELLTNGVSHLGMSEYEVLPKPKLNSKKNYKKSGMKYKPIVLDKI